MYGHVDTKCRSGFQVNHKFVFRGQKHRKIDGIGTIEDTANVTPKIASGQQPTWRAANVVQLQTRTEWEMAIQ